MRIKLNQIIYILLLGLAFSQNDMYRNTESIKDEWKGYTSYQKDEALSFCDFLFKNGHYERCLLSSFQLLYRFSDDKNLSAVYYYIARCYEEMRNYSLAKDYYAKVLQMESKGSVAYEASFHRTAYVTLMMGEYDEILKETIDDPYLNVFRGYAYLSRSNWEEARASLISAQSSFSHPHYDNLITPIYETIEEVHTIPKHNRYFVFLMSMLPGGGHFALGEKNKGQGVFSSVGLMLLISSWTGVEKLVGNSRAIENISNSIPMHKNYNDGGLSRNNQLPEKISISSSSAKYAVPPLLVGTVIFIASSYKSFNDTKIKNQELMKIYLKKRLSEHPASQFLDFPEPQLIQKK